MSQVNKKTLNPHVSVLNRHFGVMETGKVKVRGLDVRGSDTPKFIFDAQMEIIKILSSANNLQEFNLKSPEILKAVKRYRQKLINGEMPLSDLIITKHLSKNPTGYRQHVSQVIAAKHFWKVILVLGDSNGSIQSTNRYEIRNFTGKKAILHRRI